MTSATASACARSILPLAKARRVNSPGCAMRHPQSISNRSISLWIHVDPCTENSTVSSPVNECGACITIARAVSVVSPVAGSTMSPSVLVRALTLLSAFPFHIRPAMPMAFSPLILTTAMPPHPGGVDIAHIVSDSIIALLLYCSRKGNHTRPRLLFLSRRADTRRSRDPSPVPLHRCSRLPTAFRPPPGRCP